MYGPWGRLTPEPDRPSELEKAFSTPTALFRSASIEYLEGLPPLPCEMIACEKQAIKLRSTQQALRFEQGRTELLETRLNVYNSHPTISRRRSEIDAVDLGEWLDLIDIEKREADELTIARGMIGILERENETLAENYEEVLSSNHIWKEGYDRLEEKFKFSEGMRDSLQEEVVKLRKILRDETSHLQTRPSAEASRVQKLAMMYDE